MKTSMRVQRAVPAHHPLALHHAGAAHQAVEAAGVRDTLPSRVLDLRGVRDVARDELRRVTELAGHLVARRRREVEHHDLCAPLVERPGDAEAQAGRRPGDEHGRTFGIHGRER